MNTSLRAGLLLIAALLVALARWLQHDASVAQTRLRNQAAVESRWHRQIARLRGELNRTRNARPSAHPASSDSTFSAASLDPLIAADAAAWAARTARLKTLFREHPDQGIPELALLNDRDWLRLARSLPGTDDAARRAAAIARNAALLRFGEQLQSAVSGYVAATKGLLPTDVRELQPFLPNPAIAPDLLDHYELKAAGRLSDCPGTILERRSEIDPEYDDVVRIKTSGADVYFSYERHHDPADAGDAPGSDVRSAALTAARAYAAAHGYAPASPADLIPYLPTGVSPEVSATLRQPLTTDQQEGFRRDVAEALRANP